MVAQRTMPSLLKWEHIGLFLNVVIPQVQVCTLSIPMLSLTVYNSVEIITYTFSVTP